MAEQMDDGDAEQAGSSKAPGAFGATCLEVRRATPGDLVALKALYQRHHAQRKRLADERVHVWEFHDQPCSGDGKLPFFIVKLNAEIGGGIGYIETALNAAGAMSSAVFPVNYFVSPHCRGLPALRLFRAVLSECETVIGIYVSGDARRLMAKMGFVDRSHDFHSYSYALQAQPTLRSRTIQGIRRSAEVVRRAFMRILRPAIAFRTESALDPSIAGSFASLPGLCHVSKTAEFMQWRYGASPLLDARFIYQFDGSESIAMAVLHVNAKQRELIILDVLWKAGRASALGMLIDEIIRVARVMNCTIVSSQALSAIMRQVFRRRLFGSAASHLGFFAHSKSERIQDLFARSDALHFMLGDADVY